MDAYNIDGIRDVMDHLCFSFRSEKTIISLTITIVYTSLEITEEFHSLHWVSDFGIRKHPVINTDVTIAVQEDTHLTHGREQQVSHMFSHQSSTITSMIDIDVESSQWKVAKLQIKMIGNRKSLLNRSSLNENIPMYQVQVRAHMYQDS
jgi:hypothetical protein